MSYESDKPCTACGLQAPGMVAELKTRSGISYFVSVEDEERVRGYPWTVDAYGYIVCKYRGLNIKIHRLIMDAGPGQLVDHIDGNVKNNTRSNLRIANKSINALNSDKPKRTNKLGVKGVTWRENRKRYVARVTFIKIGKRVSVCKLFKKLECADEWVKNKRQEIISETANLFAFDNPAS